jgi:carbamate kinase
VDAVIDQDLAATLLATELNADALVMLTDVPDVEIGWRTPQVRPLQRVSRTDLADVTFEAGAMAPKIEAARRFVREPVASPPSGPSKTPRNSSPASAAR